ncbi:MAG: tyrosine recombinase XerC [Ruminococcaceae bacterium]|nr:tyrosine recombinase XerC [Oscillospiraceae bacterium]
MKRIEEMPELLRDFLVYMETIKGKSPKTVDEYYLDLRMFFRYMLIIKGVFSRDDDFSKIPIKEIDLPFVKKITISDIYDFLIYLSSKNLKATSRARKICAIRMFFKYLTNKKQLLEVNPAQELETPKTKSSLPRYLSLEQSIDLLKSVDGENKERDYAILLLFLTCGLRLSELVSLNYNCINDDGSILILGKGNKERTVYVNDECIKAVNAYKLKRPIDGVKDKNALFLSKQLKRISPKTVQWLVKRYIKLAGLDESQFSVHKLRHTAATLMYRNGVDVRTLKDLLGHQNLNTTQIYTHVSDNELKKAADLNPLSHIKK